ncbi:hypothetical protein NDU88_002719 [Pleurodeles waltl]|uniref:Uncharacterized protein n=1 Tax=Pleurodeles waltl TaxID=8319 RepID=A0AAV7SEG3_PLEWA|nr:hypothetical protein NDU88_002719 [Pleurodeles waltl]
MADGAKFSMVRTKGQRTQQTNQMDNYVKVGRPNDPGAVGGTGEMHGEALERVPSREPLLSEIMAAIHDLKGSLEPRLDAVAIDVGLLWADLQKVSDKV